MKGAQQLDQNVLISLEREFSLVYLDNPIQFRMMNGTVLLFNLVHKSRKKIIPRGDVCFILSNTERSGLVHTCSNTIR